MNIILSLLNIHIPLSLRKRRIKELFEITGKVFQAGIPLLDGLGYEDLLHEYAVFVKEQSGKILMDSRNTPEKKAELYHYALDAGTKLRKELHLKGMKDEMEAGRLFYSILGIDFRGDEKGEIVISKCYFSDHFSPEICEFISSLDEGVGAGLTQGKRLCFSQRITEGKSCCKAIFK